MSAGVFFRGGFSTRPRADTVLFSRPLLRGNPVHEADASGLNSERRRSQRVSKSLPIVVRGIDLLGQSFEERTSTLALNVHGCRYASKYHLPKNTWVTIESGQRGERRNLRARVAWIQRPHSVREFFQIAVELESPANIWDIEVAPADWEQAGMRVQPSAEPPAPRTARSIENIESAAGSSASPKSNEKTADEEANLSTDSNFAFPPSREPEAVSAAESPLLRGWNAQRERQSDQASEATAQLRQMPDEFEQARTTVSGKISEALASQQAELARELRGEFERELREARDLLRELERKEQELRAESNAALESVSRITEARIQAEAAEAARLKLKPAEQSKEDLAATESATAAWRERLESEMATARAQWTELLQSSLDGGVERLVKELSTRSQELLCDAEQKMGANLADLRRPFEQVSSAAREALSGVRGALDQELGRARSSLTEVENAASRMKEYSAQLEAASQDTLNELHRRLESILEAQANEMNRRTDQVVADLPSRLEPTLDSLGHRLMERTVADVEAKIAPRIERVPDLLRELAAREAQAEEGLRLHRERLRQMAENNQREAAAEMSATLARLREDFEIARTEALAKWNEELDASGVRASHAAAESIGRSSEWFQQETRSRLQVLMEQALASAVSGLDERTATAADRFELQLGERSSERMVQIERRLEGVGQDVAGRLCTQLDEAAEAAAASFGQVIRGISEQETQRFTESSRGVLAEHSREVETAAQQLLRDLESSAGASVDRFRTSMVSELDASIAHGRGALSSEFSTALDRYRTERNEHERAWTESLGRAAEEAARQYQSRLDTACDSWMISSVRKLNEHGQNATDALLRSADQSLRESFSKVFEGLSKTLRDRAASSAGPGLPAMAEAAESPVPGNEPVSSGSANN